jgi:cobalt-zinc-cadmium efflux system protein
MQSDRLDHQSKLRLVLYLNFGFMLVEATGGLMTGSMALLSDAGHMLTDVGAIALALFASWLAMRPKNDRRTYGYLRAEIIGALMNGVLLILLCGYILIEAYRRTGTSLDIDGGPVLIIALIGLFINLASARIIHRYSRDNLNMHGAYLHMLYDALGSVGAIVAGAVILLTGWTPIDTLASVLIALLILRGGWRLLMQSIDILMEGTPAEVDYNEITAAMIAGEHLVDVHDLHIWAISSGVLAMSAHIKVSDACVNSGHWPDCLKSTQQLLRRDWGIEHTTLQTEPESFRGVDG